MIYMTIKEFKAWLEGFDAAIDGSPSPEQWVKIKEKLATVESIDWSTVFPNPNKVYRNESPIPNGIYDPTKTYVTCERIKNETKRI